MKPGDMGSVRAEWGLWVIESVHIDYRGAPCLLTIGRDGVRRDVPVSRWVPLHCSAWAFPTWTAADDAAFDMAYQGWLSGGTR